MKAFCFGGPFDGQEKEFTFIRDTVQAADHGQIITYRVKHFAYCSDHGMGRKKTEYWDVFCTPDWEEKSAEEVVNRLWEINRQPDYECIRNEHNVIIS
jgi:hypothetical protein